MSPMPLPTCRATAERRRESDGGPRLSGPIRGYLKLSAKCDFFGTTLPAEYDRLWVEAQYTPSNLAKRLECAELAPAFDRVRPAIAPPRNPAFVASCAFLWLRACFKIASGPAARDFSEAIGGYPRLSEAIRTLKCFWLPRSRPILTNPE